MKKFSLLPLVALCALNAVAADGDNFTYTYEGQTLTYTVLSEDDKTVQTKSGNINSAENNMHWCLDVLFKEDACHSRKGFSAQNLSLIRKMAL
ncbi:MAG: transposase [Muribaculaceae bacterium]|nr:transposase [Muribaculaceae bacterium]